MVPLSGAIVPMAHGVHADRPPTEMNEPGTHAEQIVWPLDEVTEPAAHE